MWLTTRLLKSFVPRWEQVGEPAVRAHLLSHELGQRIAERLPGYTVTLHMEPCERCEPPWKAT